MLRITIVKDSNVTTLKLEGKISGDWVRELAQCWLAESNQNNAIKIDLTGVTFINGEGKDLLGRIFEQGSVLHAKDCMNRSIIEEIRRKHRQNGSVSRKLVTKVLTGAIILACSAVDGLRRQQEVPLRLTLHEAVQTAPRQNPEVRIASLRNYNQSRADLAQAAGQIEQPYGQ